VSAEVKMIRTISVDFDGVIHTYEKGWHDGTIYGQFTPGAMAYLGRLMDKYAVVIHTTRKAKDVARWIEDRTSHHIECTTRVPRNGFWNRQGYLLVTNRKLPSFAYIDDRAIGFRNWNQAMTALAMMERKAAEKKAP
jgi:hypothetical protein